ncbi:T9SS type A sorting domain-containing protein [candidate division KSB1 bacterium]|nr:T9SS type A sorting domain-containing protein [candidate division KSB1 bacterium]
MKKLSCYILAGLATLAILMLSPEDGRAQCSEPNYGSGITVDGDYSDWDLTADFYSEMYRAANPEKDVLSYLYVRYDCDTEMMYVMVLAAHLIDPVPPTPICPVIVDVTEGEEIWVKLPEAMEETDPDYPRIVHAGYEGASGDKTFAYFNKQQYTTGDLTFWVADGWEASFPLDPYNYSEFQVSSHNNVWDEEVYQEELISGSQTSGINNLSVCIECPPVGIQLKSFEAYADGKNVVIEWHVEAETNHAGYNLYRSMADENYVKINAELIRKADASQQYEYLDRDVQRGVYFYRLEEVSLDGQSTSYGPVQVTSTSNVDEAPETPRAYSLSRNYPNPFNPSTTISYSLPEKSEMILNIYDIHGKLIRTLVTGLRPAGTHTVTWDGADDAGELAPSGIYLYRMTAGSFVKTERMTLLK